MCQGLIEYWLLVLVSIEMQVLAAHFLQNCIVNPNSCLQSSLFLGAKCFSSCRIVGFCSSRALQWTSNVFTAGEASQQQADTGTAWNQAGLMCFLLISAGHSWELPLDLLKQVNPELYLPFIIDTWWSHVWTDHSGLTLTLKRTKNKKWETLDFLPSSVWGQCVFSGAAPITRGTWKLPCRSILGWNLFDKTIFL